MAQTTRLASFGQFSSMSPFLNHPITFNHQQYLNIIAGINRTRKKKKKNLLMAQTMCLASFGPFSSMLPFLDHPITFNHQWYLNIIAGINRTRKKKKKIFTNGPNDTSSIIWGCVGTCSQFQDRPTHHVTTQLVHIVFCFSALLSFLSSHLLYDNEVCWSCFIILTRPDQTCSYAFHRLGVNKSPI